MCEIGFNPPPRKMNTFCLRSLALSVPIYRHFQLKIERFFLYNRVLNKLFYPKFETWPFTSISLEMSINWHTKSQGHMTKCVHFSRGRIDPYLAHTARTKVFEFNCMYNVSIFKLNLAYFPMYFTMYYDKYRKLLYVYWPIISYEVINCHGSKRNSCYTQHLCGDQLLVNCLYIQVLYKQDAVSVTRLQCICGISDFELSIIAFKSI